MKIAIIYNDDLPVEKLIKAGEEYFDKVLAVPVDGFRYEFGEKNKVMYKDTNLCEFDAVYLRIHDFDLFFVEQLVEVLKENKVYVQMDPDSGIVASDKFFSMKRLRENGVCVPDSVYAISPEVAINATESLGYPVTVKLLSSFGGKGIMRASSKKELKPIMDTLQLLEQTICLQNFVGEEESINARIIVIGDKTYSMKMEPNKEEWRASPGSGGSLEEYDAPEEIRETAVKAAKTVGFDLCDVDIIVTPENAYVVEIDLIQITNEEACELTGENLRDEIMAYVHEKTLEKEANLED